jgi:SAM-dependent methyltransferase
MVLKPAREERRTAEQLREHYEVEKELAHRLRNASRQERCDLYHSLYDELYQRVPHHPQLVRKLSPEEMTKAASEQLKFLGRFLDKNTIFLEVGAGDCALSLKVAQFVKKVYAVDVSDEIVKGLAPPPNFQLILSDGCSVPIPQHSIGVAYSNQLMEHLHPDDACEQLQNIYRALMGGGVYICITPNRLGGPHDISKYFDTIATGFHLKEYTLAELNNLFQKVGFQKVRAYVGGRGKYTSFPVFPLILCEMLLSTLPYTLRRRVALGVPFRLLLGIRLVGTK